MMTLDRIAARLAEHRAPEASRMFKRSAVAAILRFRERDDGAGGRPEVLLMQRALRDGDRWSGHVSFPGGREEPGDGDLLATAIRETREEVGVDLSTARLLGRLAPRRAIAQGLPLPMTITPFIFSVDGPVDVAMGGEATAVFWLPLDAAASGALDDVHPYKLGPLVWRFPCWRHDGRVVWGLTFEMLKSLIAIVAPP